MRVWAIAALCLAPGVACGQTNYTQVPAKPSETCGTYFKGCDDWCKTKASDPSSCNAACSQQLSQCRVGGQWPINTQQKVIVGLQP